MSESDSVQLTDCSPQTAKMRADVLRGLSQTPKQLPSQYLYDECGARLFEQICELDEYYLTRTEISILRRYLPQMAGAVGPRPLVVEPGSGEGIKTRLLLEHLDDPVGYVPIDIAREQLVEAAESLNAEFPALEVLPVCADFTGEYALPAPTRPHERVLVFFPGSTIGNFTPQQAGRLLARLGRLCRPAGGLLVGVDLKKDRATLEAAYDDAAGVSAAFALNYLVRLNRELGAEFDLDQFGYQAPYNERLGRIEMSLVSRRAQRVRLDRTVVHFGRGELVHTEFSYKYDLRGFAALASQAGLSVARVWTDPQRRFSLQYLESGWHQVGQVSGPAIPGC